VEGLNLGNSVSLPNLDPQMAVPFLLNTNEVLHPVAPVVVTTTTRMKITNINRQ
jgi:hypothetical protein